MDEQKKLTIDNDVCHSGKHTRTFFNIVRAVRGILVFILVVTSLASIPSVLKQASVVHALSNGVIQKPAMGWSSWNAYFTNINASTIRATADAMVSSGMRDVGYQYVNIDAGWWNGTRDSGGNIVVNQTQWPGGMQALTSYIHSLGLKAGIYTDVGIHGCSGNNQGSYGHYDQDMLQFAQWGFDYVKVDWCGGRLLGLNPATQYGQIRDSIARATMQTGRQMVLSICNWGLANPWQWGPTTGHSWRTSDDISFSQGSVSWSSILKNFDAATLYPWAQSPGSYNDPDMMEVGASGINVTEAQAHFSLWAIAGAPLISGNNLTSMSSTTRDILTNTEVIAVDQDPLGLQGTKVDEPAVGRQVWSKVLNGTGQRAVVLLNRTNSTANITVRWSDLGLTGSAAVRNLWTHSDLGSFSGSYTASVPAHGVVMLRVSGSEATQTTYEAESPTNTLSGSAVRANCSTCSGGQLVGYIGNGDGRNGTLQFNNIQARLTGPQLITISYINGDSAARTASMSVNGETEIMVNFPSTGSWTTVGVVKLIARLKVGNNTIRFFNSSGWAPDFDRITAFAPTQIASSYEAESLTNTLSGSAVRANCSTCSGGQLVGYIGNGDGRNGTLQFNNINVSTTGSYKLVISYINGDAGDFGVNSSRIASISVNGGSAVTVSFPATGNWTLVVTMRLTVNLNAGNNTIHIFNNSSWAPDIDKIEVASQI